MLSIEEQQYLIEHLPFYSHLSKTEQTLLINNTSKRTYHKSELVYGGTTECLGVLLVKKGDLRAHLLSEQGKDVTLYRLFKGDICMLSASCILNSITFDVNVTAESPTEVYIIQATAFQKLMNQNVYVENFSYKVTTEHFSDVMWTMEQILFMSFDERLAIFLLDEATKYKTTRLTVTHNTIATFIGSAREVVSRMLKYFENEGIVQLSRGGIEILDMEKLRAITRKG